MYYNTKEDKELHGAIIVALFLLLVIIVTVKYADANANTNSNLDRNEISLTGNGNGNSIYQVRSIAQRCGNVVEVEWNGNYYTAWIDAESEIQTGDFVTAVFEVDQNGTEFVGIK